MMFQIRPLALIAAAAAGLSVAAAASSAHAAPTSIDGAIGAEWTGATVKSVLFDAAAPQHDFNAPTNKNHAVAYDVYTRGDGQYLYVGLQTAASFNNAALQFANLYFDTNPGSGSDIGFEVLNARAFKPGVAGYTPATAAGNDVHFASVQGTASTPGVIEFAVPYSIFTTNSLGIVSMPTATSAVQLRLSQTFGYSVAGGASYGDDRLGVVAVPEPTGLALLGLGAGALLRRRRQVA
jgi:PEP-CTERM motif